MIRGSGLVSDKATTICGADSFVAPSIENVRRDTSSSSLEGSKEIKHIVYNFNFARSGICMYLQSKGYTPSKFAL